MRRSRSCARMRESLLRSPASRPEKAHERPALAAYRCRALFGRLRIHAAHKTLNGCLKRRGPLRSSMSSSPFATTRALRHWEWARHRADMGRLRRIPRAGRRVIRLARLPANTNCMRSPRGRFPCSMCIAWSIGSTRAPIAMAIMATLKSDPRVESAQPLTSFNTQSEKNGFALQRYLRASAEQPGPARRAPGAALVARQWRSCGRHRHRRRNRSCGSAGPHRHVAQLHRRRRFAVSPRSAWNGSSRGHSRCREQQRGHRGNRAGSEAAGVQGMLGNCRRSAAPHATRSRLRRHSLQRSTPTWTS